MNWKEMTVEQIEQAAEQGQVFYFRAGELVTVSL